MRHIYIVGIVPTCCGYNSIIKTQDNSLIETRFFLHHEGIICMNIPMNIKPRLRQVKSLELIKSELLGQSVHQSSKDNQRRSKALRSL